MITGMKQSFYRNYSGILPQRHQDPPASPKAKPMAGRHQDYRIMLYDSLFNAPQAH